MASRVRLNVGGEVFETSLSTLERAGRDSVLGAMLDPLWRMHESQEDQGTPSRTPTPAFTASFTPAFTPAPPHLEAASALGGGLTGPASCTGTATCTGAGTGKCTGTGSLLARQQWTSAPCSPLTGPAPWGAHCAPASRPLLATLSSPSACRACSAPSLCQGMQELSLPKGPLPPPLIPKGTLTTPLTGPLGGAQETPGVRQSLSADSSVVCLSCSPPCTCQAGARSLGSPLGASASASAGCAGCAPEGGACGHSASSECLHSTNSACSTCGSSSISTSNRNTNSDSNSNSCVRRCLMPDQSLGAGPPVPRQPLFCIEPSLTPSPDPYTLCTPQRSPLLGPSPGPPIPTVTSLFSPSHTPPPAPRAPKAPRPVPELFLDRDPKVFRVLLNLLRTGNLDVSSAVSMQSLICDADYLGLLDCVKGALLPPPLDANEMEKVHTLSPNVGPTEVCTAMCGNSDGSLTVAHGSRITAYDWSLARFSTLFSELPQVDTIAHLSETLVVVGGAKSCDSLPVYDLRAASSRESKVDTIACPGASHPCFRSIVASDRHLFVASLRKSLGAEWSVGKAVAMVDLETLQSVGEPGAAPVTTRRLSGPDKLQWIESRNLLLVAKRYSVWPAGVNEGASYVRLWDPRCNQVVWDWREYEEPQASAVPADRWYALSDAVVCEDLSLLFKASPTASDAVSSRLSAVDLRCLSSSPHSGSATTIATPSPSHSAVFTTGLVTSDNVGALGGVGVGGAPLAPASSSSSLSSSSSSERAGNISTGHEAWSVLQWQTNEGLRIGAQAREPRYDSHGLRLVAVPGSSQVICNRQPTLEVWSPVAQLSQGGDGRASKKASSEGGPQGGALDPFMFRRSYADSREEYNRKRLNCAAMSSWVYDMTMAGDHRLCLVREDNRQGNVDYGSIEVWETRQNGRPKHYGML